MNLLSLGSTNAKTAKSEAIQDQYLTAILYLAPYKTSGVMNTCPKASEGCKAACLFTAGRGAFSNVMNARIRKTELLASNKALFLQQLEDDIAKFSKKCAKQGKKPCIRLNGTSDILWELTGIFNKFPEVQFYDYTKIFTRVKAKLPNNYHLTFSKTENNQDECVKALELGVNVAVVFEKTLPQTYMGKQVISGDTHDMRFLDAKGGYVIGLIAKGKAKKDNTGFTVKGCV